MVTSPPKVSGKEPGICTTHFSIPNFLLVSNVWDKLGVEVKTAHSLLGFMGIHRTVLSQRAFVVFAIDFICKQFEF